MRLWSAPSMMDVGSTIVARCHRRPEFTPIEQVWQQLRSICLSNRVFETYADIVDTTCDAWRRLVDGPGIIVWIGMHYSAHADQRWGHRHNSLSVRRTSFHARVIVARL